MKKLPIEIQTEIYEYDPTYREQYNIVIRELIFINRKTQVPKGKFNLGITHGDPITIKYYADDWKYKDCIKNGHVITIHKPYCVLGVCKCGKTQLFFYRG